MKMNNHLKEITSFVISQTGIDFRKNTRKRSYVYARSLYFKLARDYTSLSLKEIADFVNRDHATVIHNVNNVFPDACSFNSTIKLAYNRYANFKITGNLSFEDIDSLKIDNDRLRRTNNEVLNIINTVDEHHYPILLERVKSIVYMLNLTPITKTKKHSEMEGALL